LTKKVLIISYYWPPSGGSGVQRWLKFVKYLPSFGLEPIVLTVDEKMASYPQMDKSLLEDVNPNTRVEKTKTFEILNFYKKISPDKEIPYGGFTDKQKPSFFDKISRFIRGNFFLPDPRRGWNNYAFKKACEIIEKEKIDNIITTSPPHSTQLIGLKLKQKYPSLVWTADLRDPWTDIHYYKKLYPTFIADAINKRYERKVLETADKIIVTCQATKEVFAKKSNQIQKEKITVITNGYDKPDFVSVKRNIIPKFTISYIGILYDTNDLDGFLYALKNIENKETCCFRFVGHSADVIPPKIEKYKLTPQTEYIRHKPHAEAIQLMADSSVLVLLVPDKEKESSFLPGKLFEYLAVQRPILCIAPKGHEIAEIIHKCEAGKTFDYNDKEGMLDFLTEKQAEWAANGICQTTKLNYTEYSREELTKRLVVFFRKIIY